MPLEVSTFLLQLVSHSVLLSLGSNVNKKIRNAMSESQDINLVSISQLSADPSPYLVLVQTLPAR
jgi:hypothetical protein